MSTNNKTSINISGLLLVVFVILKLCKVIDWSWWWILSPFWLPILLGLAFAIFYGLIVAFIGSRRR